MTKYQFRMIMTLAWLILLNQQGNVALALLSTLFTVSYGIGSLIALFETGSAQRTGTAIDGKEPHT